jgi:hypothetical protein
MMLERRHVAARDKVPSMEQKDNVDDSNTRVSMPPHCWLFTARPLACSHPSLTASSLEAVYQRMQPSELSFRLS